MGFDDICNTGLDLGLGLSSTAAVGSAPRKIDYDKKPKSTPAGLIKLNNNDHQLAKGLVDFDEPSLTLSLSGDQTYSHDKVAKKVDGIYNNNKACTTTTTTDHHQYSNNNLCRQDSAASSFSNVSVKRERELFNEDVDTTERVFSRVSDEDEDGSNARKKLRLTKAQSAFLEESFKQHSTLNPKQKQELARELNLRPRQVEVWFQNRRARTKLKQTEVDCEYLKKCCETLTDENRRLQKELQELKALKLAQPFYMQLPAATLTMCPACERIGGVTENASKKAFNMAPKPHLFNPFTNPSAAC